MAPQNKDDRKQIEDAAHRIADSAGPKLAAALEYVDKYTDIPGHAFGVLPTLIVSGAYNDARNTQLQNLKDGQARFNSMLDGLAQVAQQFWKRDVASTIRPDDKKKIEIDKPKGSENPLANTVGGANAFSVLGLVSVAKLRSAWKFEKLIEAGFELPKLTKGANTTMCVVAGISIALWMLVEPFGEEDVLDAGAAWDLAGGHLSQLNDLKSMMSMPDDAWSASTGSRQAFNSWLANFQLEVNDAATAATANAKALTDLVENIHLAQIAMLITDIATAIALLAAWIAEQFPPARPAAMAAKIAISIANALGTACVVTIILTLVGQAAAIGLSVAKDGAFKKLEIGDEKAAYGQGSDPSKDTFIDVSDPMAGGEWATKPI
ncbi:hypothetical protein [Actinopolymorpha pittospori]|uniref:Uncharacterized protein n=1 Tax=Actinopolymorpha pittospori TaxID=648752 RepID=A0A927N080_9ACTN|nr:hypothetical protein [Actinopolymorpha pittospori]MBE1609774.1 hypothetical protein [Actinopolymorpha pittospori]